jgi:Tol biopolymer transport system component
METTPMRTAGNRWIPAVFGCCVTLLGSSAASGEPPEVEAIGKALIFIHMEDRAAKLPAEGRFNGLIALDVETSKWRMVSGPRIVEYAVSPDGRWLVGIRRGNAVEDRGIWLYDIKGDHPPRRVFEGRGIPSWSGDGKQIVIGSSLGAVRFETWRVNADGTGAMKLPLPDTDFVTDCSRDGTWLLAESLGAAGADRGRIVLVHPDGTRLHIVVGGKKSLTFARISPDGQSVAYVEDAFNVNGLAALWLVDADGGNRRKIPIDFVPGTRVRVCWSPDGSRLALGLTSARGSRIAVVDRDGKNFRVLGLPSWDLSLVDWK